MLPAVHPVGLVARPCVICMVVIPPAKGRGRIQENVESRFRNKSQVHLVMRAVLKWERADSGWKTNKLRYVDTGDLNKRCDIECSLRLLAYAYVHIVAMRFTASSALHR